MNQDERRKYLIKYLMDENFEYKGIQIPSNSEEQRALLRGLMNVRQPKDVSEEFLRVQDEYLQDENLKKGVVSLSDLDEVQEGIYLW